MGNTGPPTWCRASRHLGSLENCADLVPHPKGTDTQTVKNLLANLARRLFRLFYVHCRISWLGRKKDRCFLWLVNPALASGWRRIRKMPE